MPLLSLSPIPFWQKITLILSGGTGITHPSLFAWLQIDRWLWNFPMRRALTCGPLLFMIQGSKYYCFWNSFLIFIGFNVCSTKTPTKSHTHNWRLRSFNLRCYNHLPCPQSKVHAKYCSITVPVGTGCPAVQASVRPYETLDGVV